jgi:ornithine carbamoyltransferase
MSRHLLDIGDLSGEEIGEILDLAEGQAGRPLQGLSAGLVFERPSTRTRNSMEVAVVQLGGHPVSMQGAEVGLGVREPAGDIARVLSSYHAVLAARAISHATLEEMAAASAVPVINMLSDRSHPLQALADLLTLRQAWGTFEGKRLTWVGDGNNVCCSLVAAATAVGVGVRLATPEGYGLSPGDIPAGVELFESAEEAVAGTDAVCTDVWTSMGDEAEADQRRSDFSGFRIDADLLSRAAPDVAFLHCLPAHRGEEVTADVLDSPASRVWQQAENRLHASRGLLRFLMGDR